MDTNNNISSRITVSPPMKNRYFKNDAVLVPDTFWVRVPLGYYGLRTLGEPINFQKKKKKTFSFGYVTKINKSSESGRNMSFRCNYMDEEFCYLLCWTLVCNVKTI
jgi:hypothetical protein